MLLKYLEQFIDLDVIWGHLTRLDVAKLNDREKKIIGLFQQGLEKKKNGEPYDQIQDEETW